MSLNNIVQFPKSSSSPRRVSMTARVRRGVDLTANVGLTAIALIALGVLGTVGWVYGVCQNRTLSGMPRRNDVDLTNESDPFAARDRS